jgi:hypothetical protein
VDAANQAFASRHHSSNSDRVEACQTIAKPISDNAVELAELLAE